VITYEDALRNADSENDIRLKIKLEGKATHTKDLSAGLDSLGIV
jgi:twitching motility protein PilU